MSGRKKYEEETVQGIQEKETPETVNNPVPEEKKEIMEAEDKTAAQEPVQYKIVCSQAVSKEIGGINFQNGIAHTKDVYTASWFGNKAGYSVSKE